MVAFRKSSRFIRTSFVPAADAAVAGGPIVNPFSTVLGVLAPLLVANSAGGDTSLRLTSPIVGANVAKLLLVLVVVVDAVDAEVTIVAMAVGIVGHIAVVGGAVSLVGVGDLLRRGGTGGHVVDACGVDNWEMGEWGCWRGVEDFKRRDRLRLAGTEGDGVALVWEELVFIGGFAVGEATPDGGEFFIQHPDMLVKLSIKGLLLLWSIGCDCFIEW